MTGDRCGCGYRLDGYAPGCDTCGACQRAGLTCACGGCGDRARDLAHLGDALRAIRDGWPELAVEAVEAAEGGYADTGAYRERAEAAVLRAADAVEAGDPGGAALDAASAAVRAWWGAELADRHRWRWERSRAYGAAAAREVNA